MQKKVYALDIKLCSTKAEVVAVRLDVDVIQMTLSFLETALENKNNDMIRC